MVEGVVLIAMLRKSLLFGGVALAWVASADTSLHWRYAGGKPQFVGSEECGIGKREVFEFRNRKGYDLCLIPRLQTCLWVAYSLTPSDVSNMVGRVGGFRKDDDLGELTVDPKRYAGQGFDRGHMAPSQDMQYDLEVSRQSFWMGNITPQTPRLNRGEWKRLEGLIHRKVVASSSGDVAARRVYVLTGPIFSKAVVREYEKAMSEYEKGDRSDKPPLIKPRSFWKIYKYGAAVEAVIMHQQVKGDSPSAETGARSVSVGEISKLTGISFFNGMNKDLRQFYMNYKRPLFGGCEEKENKNGK